METIFVTGSQGFIGSYICSELLEHGYHVIGIDNFSKYGRVSRKHDEHKNFSLKEIDMVDTNSFLALCDEFKPKKIIALAAMIGGISYFHKYAYDLLATNERILATTFDGAIKLYQEGILERIIVFSSSMVFENSSVFPTPEDQKFVSPPPSSTYGFQKLASEYFCKGAYEQYGLPYTIIRPFNCIGVGEEEALGDIAVYSGNIKLMMSHVVPDLISKILKGQYPLHILGEGNQIRHYTNGRDIAKGTRIAMESEKAINEDFNISSPVSTTVLELAELIWKKINPDKPFQYVSDEPFEYDVQKRIPDTSKAKLILGFKAEIALDDSLDEIIAHLRTINNEG